MALTWRGTTMMAGLFMVAWTPQAGADVGDAAAGGVLVNAVCTECHEAPAELTAKLQGDSDADKAAWLGTFLAGHFVPEAQDQQNIAAYLLSLGE